MPVHNNDIAAVFEEIADLLEIEQANPFRIRAYRNAARTLQGLGEEVRDLSQEGFDLEQLPGIGEALTEKIAEIVRTGKCQALEKLRQEGGKGLVELLHIPGLGLTSVGFLKKSDKTWSCGKLMSVINIHLPEVPPCLVTQNYTNGSTPLSCDFPRSASRRLWAWRCGVSVWSLPARAV
jgi:hypothetical protein